MKKFRLRPGAARDTVHLYSMPLTQRQSEVLRFIRDHRRQHGVIPTVSEIRAHFGFRSPNTITGHLAALERKGAIHRVSGQARNIRLAEEEAEGEGEAFSVPLLGAIPAGFAEEAAAETGRSIALDIALLGLPAKARLYALEVRGDSMVGAGILDGDLVIVEHGPVPKAGEIVAALVDGETTLKRYRVREGRPYLQAENPAYPEIFPVAELVIQGVFRALVRVPGGVRHAAR